MALIKPSEFLSNIERKAKLIHLLDAHLHGDLKAYIISFEAKRSYDEDWHVYQISRGSADRCPYRFDHGINRDMFNVYMRDPWDSLVQVLWNMDFTAIRMLAPQIGNGMPYASLRNDREAPALMDAVRLIEF